MNFKILALAAVALSAFPQISHAADVEVHPPVVIPSPGPESVPAPPLPTAQVENNWTGIYFGAQGGIKQYNANNAAGFNLPSSIGAQGGLNAQGLFQLGYFVAGAVVDGNISSNSAQSSCLTPAGANTCTLNSLWNASARAKLGAAFDNFMVYGTGGWGWADFRETNNTTGVTDTRTLNGWVAGGGASYAINHNFVANLEVLHYDLGSSSTFTTNSGEVVAPGMNTVTLGVSYRF